MLALALAGFRAPEPAVAATAFPVVDTTLPNGLRVIIQEDDAELRAFWAALGFRRGKLIDFEM